MIKPHKCHNQRLHMITSWVVIVICVLIGVMMYHPIHIEAATSKATYVYRSHAEGLAGRYQVFDSRKKEFNPILNLNQSVKQTNKLKVVSFGFKSAENGINQDESAAQDPTFSNIAAEVIGNALVYPNPFRQNSDSGGILGYKLSKPMDIVIHIYDMLGHLIVKQHFNAGAVGGNAGYNKLRINNQLLDGHQLSSGVYFFLILNNNELLSKGKMAVKP